MLPAVCFGVKPVGKPDAVAPHVRFDERGWETGLYATAPVLDSTEIHYQEILKTSGISLQIAGVAISNIVVVISPLFLL